MFERLKGVFCGKNNPKKGETLSNSLTEETSENVDSVVNRFVKTLVTVNELADVFQFMREEKGREGFKEKLQEKRRSILKNVGKSWLLDQFCEEMVKTIDRGMPTKQDYGFDSPLADRVQYNIQYKDFLIHKNAYSDPQILNTFTRVMETPELQKVFFDITGYWPMRDEGSVSSQNLYYLFALSIQMDVHDFSAFQEAYHEVGVERDEKNLYQPTLLKSFSFLANKTRDMGAFFKVLENTSIREASFEGSFLQKFDQILSLIEDREGLVSGMLSELEAERSFYIPEYNDAVLRRLSLLISRAQGVRNEEEMRALITDSEIFKREIVAEVAFFRGLIGGRKYLSLRKLEGILKGFEVQILQGGEGVWVKDNFEMEDEDNYVSPDQFGMDEYKGLVTAYEKAHKQNYPQNFEVLKLAIPQILSDPNATIYVAKFNGKSKAIRVRKEFDNHVYEGMFYIFPEKDRELSGRNIVIGRALNEFVLGQNYKRLQTVISCTPQNKNLEGYLDSEGLITGIVKETAEKKDGTFIESEPLFKLVSGAGRYKTFFKDLYPREKIIEMAKEGYLADGIQCVEIDSQEDEIVIAKIKSILAEDQVITRLYKSEGGTYICAEKAKA